MQPAPLYPIPAPVIDAQFGPVVSEHRVGGKRYWTLFVLLATIGLALLAGCVAALAAGSIVGGLVLGLALAVLVFLLVVLSGIRIIVYVHASLVPYLTERLAAQVHQQLTSGVAVTFGKRLTLDPQAGVVYTGLLGGKQNLPFHEVESTGFERAVLAIRRRGEAKPWQTVAIAQIPNVGVFQKIIAQANPQRHAPPSGDQYGWAR